AMICGLTSIVTYSPIFGALAAYNPAKDYHGQIHTHTPDDLATVLNVERYFYSQGVLLAKKLQAVTEDPETGDSFLDRTLICFFNEHGVTDTDPATNVHHVNDIQISTLGGKYLLNTGNAFDFFDVDRKPLSGAARAYNEWLITVMIGMGLKPG